MKTTALKSGVIDIITTGRRTGKLRRTELYLHNLDEVLYLTGRPGRPRDWVANISAHPVITLRTKQGTDIAASGTVIRDPGTKASIIKRARVQSWGVDPTVADAEIELWVEDAPLVRVYVDG